MSATSALNNIHDWITADGPADLALQNKIYEWVKEQETRHGCYLPEIAEIDDPAERKKEGVLDLEMAIKDSQGGSFFLSSFSPAFFCALVRLSVAGRLWFDTINASLALMSNMRMWSVVPRGVELLHDKLTVEQVKQNRHWLILAVYRVCSWSWSFYPVSRWSNPVPMD